MYGCGLFHRYENKLSHRIFRVSVSRFTVCVIPRNSHYVSVNYSKIFCSSPQFYQMHTFR